MLQKEADMRRRELLGLVGGTAAAWPLGVLAQQEGKTAGSAGAAGGTIMRPGRAIADFIVGFSLDAVPPAVIESARIAFTDTIGVMLGGSHHQPTDIVCDLIRLEGSAPAATIVGRSLRASPQLAALANGVSGHALDFDFTYLAGQSIAGLIPAILPVAETTDAPPAEVLAAFIIGAEVAARLWRAAPTMFRLANWHATGTIGTMAAAAACARLMKAPAAAITDMLGITTSLAAGVTANFGTMTKSLHAGNAARNGVLASMLGMRGFTSGTSALEGRNGFYDNFARGLAQSMEPFADLGRRWDLVEVGYKLKPYPSGGLGHTAVDAALELRAGGVALGDIKSIEVAITKYALRRYSPSYPTTTEAAKFSGPYIAAYTLIHGAPMLAAFTEEALRDARVVDLARKVALAPHPEHADVLDESPAKVTVTLNDGRKLEGAKYYPTGSRQVPMSKAQIEDKFMTCATGAISPDAARRVLGITSTLGADPSMRPLWPLLVGRS